MAQFDVFANPNPATTAGIPYLLDVQNDLLEHLATRVVVPLYAGSALPKPIQHLNPVFHLNGEPLVMVTQELAGIPATLLKTAVANLAQDRSQIIAALDFLFTGF